MMQLFFFIILVVGICKSTFVVQHVDNLSNDEVQKLPGLTPTPRFKQYSGYLCGSDEDVQLHYWLIETRQHSTSLPLILWLNGGPGCSSLLGLFTENGPFSARTGSRLKWNPYSWNKIANVLYLETPANVGYSYSTKTSKAPGDDRISADNLHALLNFLRKFPTYYGRDTYLAGESYAGIYLPLLALKMLKHGSGLNIKGIFVGNPYTDLKLHEISEYYYLHSRGLVPTAFWAMVNGKCCEITNSTQPCLFTKNHTYDCQLAMHKLDTYVNTEIYPYVNYFNMHTPCVNEAAEPSIFAESPATKYLSRQSGRSCKAMRKENHAPLSRAVFRVASGTTACVSNSNLNSYLNTPAVRDALHISGRFEGRWEECKHDMYTMYRFDYLSTLNQYRQLLENKIPIAFLSGNLDVTSTHTGTGWFVDNLQLQVVTPKAAWFYSDRRKRCQLGGFYEKLRLNNTPLWYVIVHAAGHMIPSDQPGAALHLIRAFIQSDSPFD